MESYIIELPLELLLGLVNFMNLFPEGIVGCYPEGLQCGCAL